MVGGVDGTIDSSSRAAEELPPALTTPSRPFKSARLRWPPPPDRLPALTGVLAVGECASEIAIWPPPLENWRGLDGRLIAERLVRSATKDEPKNCPAQHKASQLAIPGECKLTARLIPPFAFSFRLTECGNARVFRVKIRHKQTDFL